VTTGWRRLAFAAPIAAAGAALLARRSSRASLAEAEASWRRIAAAADPAPPRFDPEAELSGLPEAARLYFRHAIAPGTPLSTTVCVEMDGTFLLGDARSHGSWSMTAREILAPPVGFVWMPRLRSGPLLISGSDGLEGEEAWTRFHLAGLIPVARSRTSPDLVRSARFRAAVEGLWAPASLLPRHGVRWEEAGADRARLVFERLDPPVVLELTLSPEGAVTALVGRRWSNANPEGVFRLQPFGGTVHGERRFGGFTIPNVLRIGNHYGTDDHLPFFQARVTSAGYL
jgi:hypothetical protein